jgi:signal peptidase I
MADNPFPSPQTTSEPQTTSPEAIKPSFNGAVQQGVSASEAKAEPSSGPTFVELLQYYAMSLGLLAAIWVVGFIALTLYGLRFREALGFATVIALVGSFFTRSFLPKLAEKTRRGTSPQHQQHHQSIDSAREIIETVVFVVVLVLLLKSFTAEAFVIPTGSMAETLMGYQKNVECPECKYEFPINCSQEVDPSDGNPPTRVTGCTCPNCRLPITLATPNQQGQMAASVGVMRDPGWRSGDRVLVAKFVYDLLNKDPNRFDVVVFKFPGDEKFPTGSGPVKKHVPMNYIKRLIGLPGEIIAVHRGKLWILPAGHGLRFDDMDKAAGNRTALAQLWKREFTHSDDEQMRKRFDDGLFGILRKKPENILSMCRIVYDNDHQARDLQKGDFQRWQPEADNNWTTTDKKAFQFNASPNTSWLRYRHILRNNPDRKQLITDFMGYNTWTPHDLPGQNWASDLMLECAVAVESNEGSFVLELSRGPDRFQAVFDIGRGTCTLYRITGDRSEGLATEKTKMKGKGKYTVRFANVDDRLTVWVNEKLVFGDGIDYPVVRNLAPTKENDVERPASIAAQGAKVTVSQLKLFRDTYYTTARTSPGHVDVNEFRPDDPETWPNLAKAPFSTYYVQPEHYLCLGDNSPESSDGRSWGLVPKRLLLGRAMLVYYPFSRVTRIR